MQISIWIPALKILHWKFFFRNSVVADKTLRLQNLKSNCWFWGLRWLPGKCKGLSLNLWLPYKKCGVTAYIEPQRWGVRDRRDLRAPWQAILALKVSCLSEHRPIPAQGIKMESSRGGSLVWPLHAFMGIHLYSRMSIPHVPKNTKRFLFSELKNEKN